MPSFDQSNFRAFRLHTIVQNVGTELYLKYLKKKAEESFPSLKALLDNPTEKAKLLQAFKKDPVYSPYDDSGNLKPVYPESMDIIKLNKLHKYCEVLRKDSVASQFDHWWNSKNGELVFDAVSKSKRCLLGQPGTACLVLYHVRNRLLPGPQKNEFSLDEKAYSMALDVAIPALEVLAVHLGMEDSVEFRISKAKRDTIDENACSDVFTHYKLDMSSMRSDAGKLAKLELFTY